MTIKHLTYLFSGIVVWGIVIGAILKLLFHIDDSYTELFFIYIFVTLFFTFNIWFYGGEFSTKSKKRWFFLPLFAWVVALIELAIEGSFFDSGIHSILP